MQNKQAMYALASGFLGLTVLGSGSVSAAPLHPALHAAPVSATNTITSVSVTAAGEATKITVVGTLPFTPDVRSLLRPSATVITIEGTWNAGRTGYTNVRKNNVYNVRAGRFSNLPTPTVRIVANTRGSLIHAARPLTSDNTQWEILVGSTQSVHAAASSAAVAKTILGIREPAATPLLLTPPTNSAPAMTASAENNAPVQTAALRLAADLARPAAAAAPQNGPYPALLRTPSLSVRASVPPSVPGMGSAAAAPVLFAAPVPRPAPAAKIAAADRRVSLDFVGADIVDVLKALSLQSGLNVVAGSDVKGIVTVALKNVPMIEALDMVTRLSGFRYAKVGTTYVVGTGASVAALSRSSSQGQAVSASVAFYYSDGLTLEKSIIQAFPNANVSRVDVGADARKESGSSSTSSAASFSGSSASINKDSATRFSPRGGVMNVVGSQDEVDAIKAFVQGTEEGLVASARQQQDAETKVLALLTTETYQLKYASPSELVGIVNRLVPSVQIQAGPTQAFQPRTLNGSASFSSSSPTSASSSPSGGATAGGGAGSNTGAATTGAIATNGPVAPSQLPPTLILTGTVPDLARARKILEDTDLRSPQMAYEAKVVDINASDIKQLGLRYDFSRIVNLGEPNLKQQGQSPSVGTAYNDDLRKLNFGTIFRSPYSISVALDALENDNKAHVLARPNLSHWTDNRQRFLSATRLSMLSTYKTRPPVKTSKPKPQPWVSRSK